MAVMWRCSECETMNTEDKCIVCGCLKPGIINNTSNSNIVQEQLKVSNSNQESLKSIQNGNQYKINNQQNRTNSVKTPASNRKKKNKKIPIAIVSCITTIFIVCAALGVMKNYVDIADKHEETLPSLTTFSTTELDMASAANEVTVTAAPVSEEETTTTVTCEFVTENVVEDDMVVMPSLIKQDFIEATKILDELGLQYKITYSDKKYVDVGENCVYSQNPATGKEIKRDTVVELGISTYQQTATTPTTTTVSQTTPPVTATRTKQITKDIEIPINNAKMTNGSWNQSISLDKTDFDCSCITPDTIVKVEFELGAPCSKENAPVELILQNYTSNPNIWAKIAPFEYDYDKKSASFDYKSMVSSYGSDDFSTVDCLHIGDRGVYIKVTRLTITNCSVNSELFDEKNNSGTNKTTENSTTSKYARSWNETEIHETLYIKTSCYSRTEAVVGADSIKKYEVGTKIDVVAVTDTGYYKLYDGSFIHSDYVIDKMPEDNASKITVAEKNTSLPKLNQTSVTLTKGYTTMLSVSNASDTVTWSTGDRSIVTVSSKGRIVGLNPGTTYIYAKTGSTTLKCKVTVVASKITANKSSVTLDTVGATATVTFTVKGSHSGIMVSSTDSSVATADFSSAIWDGDNVTVKITATGSGNAKIKVYNENYQSTCYKYVDVSVEDIQIKLFTDSEAKVYGY